MTRPTYFLDIETVFREDSRVLLERAYPPKSPGMDYVGSTVMDGTQKEVEQYVDSFDPSPVALMKMINTERAGKARKGVLELLNKKLSEFLEDPIPDKTKMIPECCEVIAIGYGEPAGFSVTHQGQWAGEAEMLESLWRRLDKDMANGSHGPYGWRLSTFDMPVLIAASARHNVPIPAYITAGSKYNTNGFVDMASRRGWPGKIRDICLSTGFDDSHDPLGSGGGVANAWTDGRIDDIVRHCMVDLERNHHIYKLYNGILW